MSELKEWTASEIEEYDDARLELAQDGKIDCTRVYIKSEADKVIAELEDKLRHYPIMTALIESGNKEIAELQKQVHDYAQGLYVIQAKAEKEVRHQKHKRCLAMAEKCDARYDEEDAKVNGHAASWEYISKEMKYWERWRNRWLAIAEKFKEAK